MSRRPPFHSVQPAIFSGLLDDPLLLLTIRRTGRSLLFDCGRIHHLAKRVIKSLDALFITHAHMDHFMGIDTIIRHTHVSPRTVELFGPPGISDKMAAKFSGYDWNLTEPYWCSFLVHEIHGDRVVSSLFPGPEGFARRHAGEWSRQDKIIYRNDYLRVEADLCDHKLPVLIFRIDENPPFKVDEQKIERAGLVKGDWLRTLKKRICQGDATGEPLKVPRLQNGSVTEELVEDLEALYGMIREEQPPASIGYVTDIGLTDENIERVTSLLGGVTLFICECSFLAREQEKARISAHLCTRDVNFLLDRLRPDFFLPLHLSKSYIHHWENLYDELAVPPGVTLLRLPKYLTPRPLLTHEAFMTYRSGSSV